jgi:purine nucleosidase/pyrimidine-specific ribonucleoside hydrolase
MVQRVIIDTDPGIDDALALLLAFQSPELEVAAVTTVSGNVSIDDATRNVFTVFSLLPPSKRPPVARGAARPRLKAPAIAYGVHGKDGLGDLARYRDASGNVCYPAPPVEVTNRDAADEILYQLRGTEAPLTIIALGPLTNIAAAIERAPEIMAETEQIVAMGGAVGVPGNVTPAAEFNIHTDPHAAKIVFASGIPLTVVGLDVTRRVKLAREALAGTGANAGSAVGKFLKDCTEKAFIYGEKRSGAASITLHDPLAVGAVIDRSFLTTEPMHVQVEARGEVTEGMTLADRRPISPEWKSPPNAQVGVGVEADRFIAFFLERLLAHHA